MSRCKLDTDVHKIFSRKVSFKCCCQVDSWLLIKNLNIAVIKHFRDDTFGKINITTEVVFIQLLSYNVVSKQKKNKNENAECHGIFIPLKSHLNSKQGSLIFLLKTVNEFCVSNGAK